MRPPAWLKLLLAETGFIYIESPPHDSGRGGYLFYIEQMPYQRGLGGIQDKILAKLKYNNDGRL